MSKNIYNEYVIVTDDLNKTLKKCFMNHLVVYNYSLGILYENPETVFNSLIKTVTRYIKDKKIEPIIFQPLTNEIYYQYKKFKRNIRVQKLITDIQYFTFLSNGNKCKNLLINNEEMYISINNFEGKILLDKPLPEILENSITYINLSYSNMEDRYKLSIYST